MPKLQRRYVIQGVPPRRNPAKKKTVARKPLAEDRVFTKRPSISTP
jgi:hypothetical protein